MQEFHRIQYQAFFSYLYYPWSIVTSHYPMALNTIYLLIIPHFISSPDLSELQIQRFNWLPIWYLPLSLLAVSQTQHILNSTLDCVLPSLVCFSSTVTKEVTSKSSPPSFLSLTFDWQVLSMRSPKCVSYRSASFHLQCYCQSPRHHHVSLRHWSSLISPHFHFWPPYNPFSSQVSEWAFKNATGHAP